ncbi:MAG: NADH-quinone oxidoreductase subunit C [Chloroflexota bacterium]|nr:NADH-quinone oxidoreductase subunit C [Chloroflexota bacterium]
MNVPKALDPAAALKSAMPDALLDTKTFRDELTLIVEPSRIPQILHYLRDTQGLIYNFLSDISTVDYYPETRMDGQRYGLSYHLYSMLYNRRLRVKVYLFEDDVTVPSCTEVFPGANWLEREAYDMMGIVFEGHPDLRRVLMPDDWDGHPHRRDYPLGYEQIMFSFNVEDIAKHKPFAKE